jgi:tetratricopeptide (TPR) repeat protein
MVTAPVNFHAQILELSQEERWQEQIDLGTESISTALASGDVKRAAGISAELASAAFYLGDYADALKHAVNCEVWAGITNAKELEIRGIYLQSACYRAEKSYHTAVALCQVAQQRFEVNNLKDKRLEGKILFNLGAAHSDDPDGDLKAALSAFETALCCFAMMEDIDDIWRTQIRIGRVHLLQKNFDEVARIIEFTKQGLSLVKKDRIKSHLLYLEAQYLQTIGKEFKQAAAEGLELVTKLNAKGDIARFIKLKGS